MTLAGRLISLFPALYLVIELALLAFGIHYERPVLLVAGLLHLYLTPLALFKIHEILFPLSDGDYDLSAKSYNPWWTSYMLQYPFIALPGLEALLRFVPGLFTLWIRAWGGKIGKNVLWTPRVEIVDRSMIEIGDHVVIGHMSMFCSHAITSINGKPILRLKTIRVGERSLIGGDSQLGPGSLVEAGTMLPAKTRLYWNGVLPT